MADDTKDKLATVAKVATIATMGPLGFGLGSLILDMMKTSETKIERAPKNELEMELAREEGRARVAEAMAHAAQEFAIASRIASADEVEIEEFYDASGEGSAGLKGDGKAQTLSLGASASGRKVTKRIIKFKGGAVDPAVALGPRKGE